MLFAVCYDFNPRTRMGCDLRCEPRADRSARISIHAPAWGATMSARGVTRYLPLFQSTHPHGVRLAEIVKQYGLSDFNPRTRMGCDRKKFPRICTGVHFNPRTRMGCDLSLSCAHLLALIYFNPRTRMGCDPDRLLHRQGQCHFNPRTRMGCD